MLRLAMGCAATVVVLFAAMVLWLRYVALPNVDSHRERVVASIEKASGMSVSVRAIRGHWGGLRPMLSLEGLALADKAGRAAFQLERAELTLSWWWLAVGELRFHRVEFHRPDLVLRRGADGLIYLADKPLDAAGPEEDGAFTQWLLSQPRLAVHDATLTWRDDFAGAPEVRLGGVDISIRKRLGRHRAALTAAPPRELARRLDIRADVAIQRRDERWRAQGHVFVEALDGDLARLRSHLPLPESLRSAAGSARVWLDLTEEGVSEVVADLNVRDARAQLAADALPLALAALSGRARYKALPDGYSIATEGLRFRLADGSEAQPGNFSLVRKERPGAPARTEVQADGIDLKIAATLLDYFPVPRELKLQAVRFAPRGRIARAQVGWDDGGAAYSLKGRFEGLAVNAVDAFPGVAGLTGEIEGGERGGKLLLASGKSQLELSRFFPAPLAFDQLRARVRWNRPESGLEVHVDEAHAANPDATLRFSGMWRALPREPRATPGFVDFKGTLEAVRLPSVPRYLPIHMAEARQWLDGAILAGESSRAEFELKGDLWDFPFGGETAGIFRVRGDLTGGRLRYHPAWPTVDAIEGSISLHNRSLAVEAQRAAIFGSRVRATRAVLQDLAADPPLLVVEGEIDTNGADASRFLRESPLASGPGAVTRVVAIEGPGKLKMKLDFPLWGPEPARVAGEYTFANATATVARNLALREINGRLAFSEKGVRAPEITGMLFGAPARLAIQTQPDGLVHTAIDGRMDAVVLGAYLPDALGRRFSGRADWKARLVTGGDAPRLAFESDLKGMQVQLPEPLAKPAETSRPLRVTVSALGQPAESYDVQLGDDTFGRAARVPGSQPERWRAALKFGAPLAEEPLRDGLWLYGRLARLDVDAWQGLFAVPETPAPAASPAPAPIELRGVDLAIGRGRFMDREFQQMRASLERTGTRWAGALESPLIAGEVRWNGEGRGSLVARLDRFAIPEAAPGARPAPVDTEPAELPAIDLQAKNFVFRGRPLGALQVKAQPQKDEWHIDQLDIALGHTTLTSKGAWRRTGSGSITTLAVKLEANNLNALLEVFGYGDYLKRGAGRLEGTLAWPGQPHEFNLSNLAGNLKLEAKSGQFAKIEPGAGKLLGLLSLQSLPKRALFDFRDVFSQGFAFDKIEGDVKVARGVLLTDDFSISGSSAFVNLSGQVSMPEETQALTLKVVPEVGEGMALAATVFGTPVLGLSTLLMSKLLKNPLGKAVSYEYHVTGTWDNPVVTRTSAPPAKTAASRGSGEAAAAAPAQPATQ